MQDAHPEAINLGLGQLTYLPDPQILTSLQNFSTKDLLYGPNAGIPELRRAIAEKYIGSFDSAIVTVGVQEALFDSVLALKKVGAQRALIPSVAFGAYKKICDFLDIETDTFSVGSDFTIDFSSLDAKLKDQPDFIFLNFPNNPSGTDLQTNQLKDLVSIISPHFPYIISDEIYSSLRFNAEPVPRLIDIYDRTIVVDGVSKSGAVAGLRVGWAFTRDSSLSKIIASVATSVKSNPPILNQRAALPIVLGETQDTINHYISLLRENSVVVQKVLDKMDLDYPIIRGGFYAFPKFPGYNGLDETMDFCEFASQKKDGVIVIPGSAFGDPHRVRISFAAENIEEGMRRFQEAYNIFHDGK